MLPAYLEFAINLSKTAGAILLEHFDTELTVAQKADTSPVTQVDMAINELVVQTVRAAYPEHGILGEEGHVGTGRETFKWVCDPSDGTRAYVLGIPNSMFMIALLQSGRPIISVIYHPFAERLYTAARGQGAFCNNAPIHVNSHAVRDGYVLFDMSSYTCLPTLKLLGGLAEPVSGTGYKCMLIARGRAVGFINHTPDFHDVAPISLILEEAGGKITDAYGKTLQLDTPLDSVVASNGVAHDELLQMVQMR